MAAERPKSNTPREQIEADLIEVAGRLKAAEDACARNAEIAHGYARALADVEAERDKYREALGGLVSCLDGEDDDGLGGLTRDSLDALDRARAALSDPQEDPDA